MNRRIVLVDQEETPTYARYYGSGFSEVYTLQSLYGMSEAERLTKLSLGESDGVLIVGGKPFKYLKSYYHFGVRNETYTDCAMLPRLSMEGGAFSKVVVEYPSQEDIDYFLSPEFVRPVSFSGFQHKIIHDYQGALRFLEYLDSLPLEQHYGMDYEASGMPLDKEFWLSGVAICTERFGGFISLTDIRHSYPEGSPEYSNLLRLLGEFFKKRMDHIWTYNMQYEWQVSHRVLGVDLYNLCDASAVNVMDGFHLKKFSLKWTAQRVLGVNVWDSEFDRISELIDSGLYEVVGKLKKDQRKVFKVDQSSFYNTPEWNELSKRYPDYIGEFNSLMLEYWGYPFMCVPSEILGHYCCLDSFYTLLIAMSRFDTYSEDCWKVNLDNIRLGARLMGSGLYIDEPFRQSYEKYCHEQMAWSITYCAQARCYIKMQAHSKQAASLKRYHPVAVKLLEQGKFHNGDVVEIVKDLLLENLDSMDSYSTGLNEGGILIKYGPKFANGFLDIVRGAMSEVKMATKIDETVKRKKKLISLIADKFSDLVGIRSLELDPAKHPTKFRKHVELEKYLYYKKAYAELEKVKKQLSDIHNVPDVIYAFGEKRPLVEYAGYVSDNYFKCKSPIENDQIAFELATLYRPQTCYLAAMIESTQQLEGTDKFYSDRGITDINVGYNEFFEQWRSFVEKDPSVSFKYPDKVFNIALTSWQATKKLDNMTDGVKEIWTNLRGFQAQTTYFPALNEQYTGYEEHFEPTDMDDDFYFMRKMVLNYLIFKKYSKLDSTYVGSDGMFHKTGKWVIEGQDHIPIREADENEPGAVWKVFTRYEVLSKSSKRWSSPFHTIISHGDCKDVLCPPPSWDSNGNIIYGGSSQILTYFDIIQN